MNKTVSDIENIKAQLYLKEEKDGLRSGSKRGRKPNSNELTIITKCLKSKIIDIYKAILLILKLQYEKFCENNPLLNEAAAGSPLNESEPAENHCRSFVPGADGTLSVEQIYNSIEKSGRALSREGIDEVQLAMIMNQMIIARVHILGGIDSKEFEKLTESLKNEVGLLESAEKQDKEVFLEYKKYLLELEKKVEDVLFEQEEKRIKNQEVNTKWMNIFGKLYIEFIQAESELKLLKCRIELKIQFPDKPIEEINQMILKRLKEEKEKIEIAKNDCARAAYAKMIIDSASGIFKDMPSEEYFKEYNKSVKKRLLDIYQITHPDTTISNKKLTDKQKRTLADFFENAIKIRDSEAGFHVRSLSVLNEIYDSARSILEFEGLDINYNAVIRGNTLKEQIEWLRKRIEYNELQISDIRNSIHVLLTDRDILEKIETMSTSDTISTYSKQIKNNTDILKNDIAEFGKKLNELSGS